MTTIIRNTIAGWTAIAVVVAAAVFSTGEKQHVSPAPDPKPYNMLTDPTKQDLVEGMQRTIRRHGWKCDTIDALHPMILERGLVMVCNNFKYTYDFKDIGGNIEVTVRR
jgi:hypothetical protein